jgi:SAM-dependent methyltransferase
MSGRLLRRAAEDARVYDAVQTLAGYPILATRLRRLLGQTDGLAVLDAGAGTGALGKLVPRARTYTALEIDPKKIERLRRRMPNAEVITGSITAIPLPDKAMDVAAMVNVSHHLSDEDFELALAELGRVTRGRVIVADPVADGPLLGRALWRIDRGSHPRTARAMRAAIERHLCVGGEERLTILHRYFLCSAIPR